MIMVFLDIAIFTLFLCLFWLDWNQHFQSHVELVSLCNHILPGQAESSNRLTSICAFPFAKNSLYRNRKQEETTP